ncbi:hypothetical protein BE08_20225 [Sorangium cellulosum]|uniref:Uncharacterized protein n=1 Tax=Sorangium cellulosum TaxID=56 RepID=A0A150PHD3_SORCE|nr:hypothetical protein BE08_20225 [Sorangium cellulosum]
MLSVVLVVIAEMRARSRQPSPAARAPSAAAAARGAVPRVTGAARQGPSDIPSSSHRLKNDACWKRRLV